MNWTQTARVMPRVRMRIDSPGEADDDLRATHDIEGHDERASQCTDHERYGPDLLAGELERTEPDNRRNHQEDRV